jgi:hypothetical protein
MFEQYLLTREIKLPEPMITSREIMDNPEILTRVGAMVKEYRHELDLIILARLSPLREELLLRAEPVEVTELRRVILEIATFADDFNGYDNALTNLRKLQEEEVQRKLDEDKDNPQPKEEGTL